MAFCKYASAKFEPWNTYVTIDVDHKINITTYKYHV